MNDTYITIVGNVVDEPRLRTTSSSGVPVLSFRVASTSRRLDRETGKWQDSDRLFATVTCWRALAQNVARSLKKGQPVIVTGRFYSREYTTKDETSRVSYEVDAAAIGHDLSRGVSEFTKVVRPVATTTVDVGPDGIPEDLTARRFDVTPGPEAVFAAVG
jgi:single-strand DNA-binding protein